MLRCLSKIGEIVVALVKVNVVNFAVKTISPRLSEIDEIVVALTLTST